MGKTNKNSGRGQEHKSSSSGGSSSTSGGITGSSNNHQGQHGGINWGVGSSSSNNNDSNNNNHNSRKQGGGRTQRDRQQQNRNNTNRIRNHNAYFYPPNALIKDLLQLLREEREGLVWLVLCVLLGIILGLAVGSGYVFGVSSSSSSLNKKHHPASWRIQMGKWIRGSTVYNALNFGSSSKLSHMSSNNNNMDTSSSSRSFNDHHTMRHEQQHERQSNSGGGGIFSSLFGSKSTTSSTSSSAASYSGDWNDQNNHPILFYTLREMIIRSSDGGGYVHPDLGLLIPAPCGASRGLGMVRSSFNMCQMSCSQGGVTPPRIVSETDPIITKQRSSSKNNNNDNNYFDPMVPPGPPEGYYAQEEILLRIPLSIQITRFTALKTLRTVIPSDVQQRVPLEDLDDFALLVLVLAHERGRMRDSMYWPYIASLPSQPTCGYSAELRPKAMELIAGLGSIMGLDVNGWPTEITKVYEYAERISNALAKDYGLYIRVPKNVQVVPLLQWALCTVASRAIGGRPLDPVTGKPIKKRGGASSSSNQKSLRLVPMVDLINHDVRAGLLQELFYQEDDSAEEITEGSSNALNSTFITLEDGRIYTHMKENEQGTFIVRNLRDGQLVALAENQELLINYNVPEYSALDWYVTMGFVPPERVERWIQIDRVLPHIKVADAPQKGGIVSN